MVTDRAQRYRANRVHKLKKRCEECRSRGHLGVGHRDGNESNNRPSNLFTQCKSCNGKQTARDIKAGRGVRTRQYNPEKERPLTQMTLAEIKKEIPTASPKRLAEIKNFARWRGKHKAWFAKNPGATNLAQYVQAAVEHTRKAHDAGGKIIHETPKSKRREFAREIAFRKGHRNPARQNPETEADALYRKFHGRGPDTIYELQVKGIDPYGGHPELTSLGPLIRFIVGEGVVLGGEYGDEVEECTGWVREISFVPSVPKWHQWLEDDERSMAEIRARLREYETPDLAAVPNTKQLYILGGEYPADLGDIAADPEKDVLDLGSVFLIEYFTQKRFDRFEPIGYFHHFSERSKQDWPRLIYDRVHRVLSLAGGAYRVTPRGIEN
jgi:hypothetical protein